MTDATLVYSRKRVQIIIKSRRAYVGALVALLLFLYDGRLYSNSAKQSSMTQAFLVCLFVL